MSVHVQARESKNSFQKYFEAPLLLDGQKRVQMGVVFKLGLFLVMNTYSDVCTCTHSL